MEQNVLDGMYEQLGISKEVLDYAADIEKSLKERFERIDQTAEYNQLKVLKGMQDNKVSDIHFAATTGYGYNDLGRDTLEDVYASVFHAESALVRPQLISGTHALHIALSGSQAEHVHRHICKEISFLICHLTPHDRDRTATADQDPLRMDSPLRYVPDKIHMCALSHILLSICSRRQSRDHICECVEHSAMYHSHQVCDAMCDLHADLAALR